jgi:hypothetical protein
MAPIGQLAGCPGIRAQSVGRDLQSREVCSRNMGLDLEVQVSAGTIIHHVSLVTGRAAAAATLQRLKILNGDGPSQIPLDPYRPRYGNLGPPESKCLHPLPTPPTNHSARTLLNLPTCLSLSAAFAMRLLPVSVFVLPTHC